MNCQSFENNVTDLARRQPLEANALEEARRHSESCPTCALRLSEQRALTLGLRSLAQEFDTLESSDRVESQLVAAFRQQMASPRKTLTASRRWVAVAAIAAMLLVVSAAVAIRLSSVPAPLVKQENTQAPANEVAPKQVKPENNLANASIVTTEGNSNPGTARRVFVNTHRPRRVMNIAARETINANRNSLIAEVTTDFISLGDTSITTLQDGAQVVRVEMPRSAMARLGLPVNMDRYDEKVKADVWVGVDGLARAIRFVQ